METQQKEISGWDEYITNFLETSNVKDENDGFLCIGVEEIVRDEKKQIRLTLQKGENDYAFDLNKTNTVFLKTAGIVHPSNIDGKILFFRKVKAYSPNAKKEVDSVRICRVEDKK